METFVPTMLTLEEFVNLELTVLRTVHHADFTVIEADDRDGQRLICVQGVMTGLTLITPIAAHASS
jgi:hypothetical protein